MGNSISADNSQDDASQRALPHFVVIGSMRSGTTYLYDLLRRVDGICLASMKETDYFIAGKNFARGEHWYQRQFARKNEICGEISPNYTKRHIFPDAAENCYAANSDAKLIYIVRDPVSRAVSEYKHSFHMGRELPDPEHLLASEIGGHIAATSRYAWQLEPWISRFGRDAILIVDFNDLVENTDRALLQICQFIGLDEVTLQSGEPNTNSAEQVGSMPKWWLRLRETKLGDSLRAMLPRKVLNGLKGAVRGGKSPKPLPEFPDHIIEDIRNVLAEDTAKFQDIVAQKN